MVVCSKCKQTVMVIGKLVYCDCKNSPRKASEDLLEYVNQR